MRRTARLLPFLLPMLMASKCGKKVVDDGDITGPGDPNPPEVRLQVISVDPDEVPPGKAFQATVYGSAIEEGADVWVGGAPMPNVDWKGENALLVGIPPLTAGEYDIKVQNPDGQSATLRGGLWVNPDYRDSSADRAACGNLTVRFDFDSATMGSDGRALLDAQAECINRLGGPVRIEGHCDERGTTEYNLALGQRRADAIRAYLQGRGVPPSRLRTISYGEEKPASSGSGESAWAANRRVEIVVEP